MGIPIPTQWRRVASDRQPLLTPKAKAAAWDWTADVAYQFAGAMCGGMAFSWRAPTGKAYAFGQGAAVGWLIGALGTVVVPWAIHLYHGHRARRFSFMPAAPQEVAA